ncbi:hypothetical protein CNR22_20405 [Sphingobacteriaceae bacterium]|nr:hypothetical protein CNR22_20405 [Sphingobacteriaceae bacterium]
MNKKSRNETIPVLDRRFAIIIGINDYDDRPLKFCVNDANAVSSVMIERCGFLEDDIYLITSSKELSIKDIWKNFEKALDEIKEKMIQNEDSLFFYFAGHGKFSFENSSLLFNDSFVEMRAIFDKISALQPKYQCYVIDACESGAKVLSRSTKENSKEIITSYLNKSKGICFMFAAAEDESATELGNLQHGRFTHHFLSAIRNDKNYEEGTLTVNRIMDSVTRETAKDSKFKQTPVIESRAIGLYPFAIITETQKVKASSKKVGISEKIKPNKTMENKKDLKKTEIGKEHFPDVPLEIRKQVFEELKVQIAKNKDSWVKSVNLDNYKITEGNGGDYFYHTVRDELEIEIVKAADSKKIFSLNDVLQTTKRENKRSVFSFIDAFTQQDKYSTHYSINFQHADIIALSIHFKSLDVRGVSFGVLITIFQAQFGLGLAKNLFDFKYTGYEDKKQNQITTYITAYKFHDKTVEKIITSIANFFTNINKTKDAWNEERASNIDAFDKISF